MRNTIFAAFAALAALFAVASPASAEVKFGVENPYVAVGVSASFLDVVADPLPWQDEGARANFDDGFVLNGAAGATVAKVPGGSVRLELGVARTNQDLMADVIEASATETSLVAFYDANFGGKVTPYVGAGVQRTSVEVTSLGSGGNGYRESSWGPVVAGGVRAALTENLLLDVGVRYSENSYEYEYCPEEFIDVDTAQVRPTAQLVWQF